MKMLLLFFPFLLLASNPLAYDFGRQKAGTNWRVINDGVMGGLSQGQLTLENNCLRFRGSISLENNGGFASIRSPFAAFDLSQYSKVRIRYRSQGQDFALCLEKDRRFYRPNYKQYLPITNGEWQEKSFELLAFQESVLGRPTGQQLTAEDLPRLIRLGIISNSKKAGDFELEVDYLIFE